MLDKFLKKIGVSSYEDLNSEEKNTYKEWEVALSGRKLTDKDVKSWLEEEYNIATSRLIEEDLSDKTEALRKAEVKLIKKILNFLNSPMVEKQFAEKSIGELLK